ncbi:TPA: DUF309 domain-containing protein [Candidatus Latescibacteria bacterium]|nr:DUF309 domain-containing protein [Candidatus Latescibacterota bacterium]
MSSRMDDRIRSGLEKGIHEFNEEAFFEAHDTLEDVWMDARGDVRLFLQGLIQLCIGYYHMSCDNFRGADHLLGRGIEKLETYPAAAYGVDLKALLAEASKTHDAVRQSRNGLSVAFWPIPKISTIDPVDSGSEAR